MEESVSPYNTSQDSSFSVYAGEGSAQAMEVSPSEELTFSFAASQSHSHCDLRRSEHGTYIAARAACQWSLVKANALTGCWAEGVLCLPQTHGLHDGMYQPVTDSMRQGSATQPSQFCRAKALPRLLHTGSVLWAKKEKGMENNS